MGLITKWMYSQLSGKPEALFNLFQKSPENGL